MKLTLATIAALAVLAAACGSTSTTATSTAESGSALSCAGNLDEIVMLLQSGLPTYDYEPADDLADLAQRSAAVLTGTIDRVDRTGWTTVSTADAQVLWPTPWPGNEITQFSTETVWALSNEPDPLAGGVSLGDVAYVAFLYQDRTAPGGFGIDVQGLVVSCVSSVDPAISIIEPLPSDAANMSIEEVVEAISSLT